MSSATTLAVFLDANICLFHEPNLARKFPSIPTSMPLQEALTQLQELLKDQTLGGAQYFPDVPINTPAMRAAAGLPPTSLIWPLAGDQLAQMEVTNQIPGIHSPLAYLAGTQFGSLFNLHVEDFDLFSLSHLHHGRKVWIVIPPAGRRHLEKIMGHSTLLDTPSCAQFIRHNNMFALPDWLDSWKIPYHVVDQQAEEIVVTFPGTYHEGFSIGPGVSEACNHAAEGWTFNADLGCPDICGTDAVIASAMRQDSPGTPASTTFLTTGSTPVDPSTTGPAQMEPPTTGSNPVNSPTTGLTQMEPLTTGSTQVDPPTTGSTQVDLPATGSTQVNPPATGSTQVDPSATGSTQVDPLSSHRQLRGKQVPFLAFLQFLYSHLRTERPVPNPASLASSQITAANPRKRRGAAGKSGAKPHKRAKLTNFDAFHLQLAPGFVSEEEVLEAFKHTKEQELLIGMFFSIGNLPALTMLHEACKTMHQLPQLPSLSSSNVAITMKALEQTEKVWYIANLLKRYHLVRLVEHSEHILNTLPLQPPNEPHERPASRMHKEMMRLAHPEVSKEENGFQYDKLHTQLNRQLVKGRKWNELTRQFGMGVLALVPINNNDSYNNSQ